MGNERKNALSLLCKAAWQKSCFDLPLSLSLNFLLLFFSLKLTPPFRRRSRRRDLPSRFSKKEKGGKRRRSDKNYN